MRPPLEFFVAGTPKGQPRARSRAFRSKGGSFASRVYDPGTADEWKVLVRNECAKVFVGQQPFEGPVRVDITFQMPRPKSHFRANGLQKENAPSYHTGKPDRDNLDKAVLDALTQLGVWKDDAQVAQGTLTKLYNLPGAWIKISEIV